ncbi:MAG: three-Cys-motif partner protein TcmP [Chloroflexi bacterium]|nr:three-Cys-motif partner protein TcmP [Chloroflexota bacterium]
MLWDIEPHTQAKHDILTHYLQAWFAILAQARMPRRLLYIDGFAGPGEYRGGEPGSPILALDAVLQHRFSTRITRPGMDLVFVFIEERQDRFDNLQRKLADIRLPSNVRVYPICATFEQVVGEQLARLEEQNQQLAPSFVFIDPFGVSGFPMSLVERFAQHSQSEVLINFSYQPLNQYFLQIPSQHARLDELFGDTRWRTALDIIDSWEREVFLVREYQRALEERGWRGLSFRMMNKHNQTQYHLLFGTKYYLGMLKMKEAMWSVASDGVFQYSDFSDKNQLRLFSKSMDQTYGQELADLIWQNRRGTRVTKQELREEETAYHPTCREPHLTRALQILEYETQPSRIIDVKKPDGTRRKAKSYPDGCTIQFAT